MFFQKNNFKKIISTFLIVTILVPSLFLTQPKKALALFGAGDTVIEVGGNLITNIKNTVESTLQTGYDTITSSATWYSWTKENVLDGIAWTIAKQAIRSMTTSIVNWINSGFEGSPAFVTDFEGMMTDIADGVIGEYLYENGLESLCSPFNLQVKLSLYNTFYGEEKKYECTVSDMITNAGGALQSLEDDFTWGTWIEMTSKESNNVYGAFLEAEESILKEIGLKQEKTTLQANWGNGFLSWEKCEIVGGVREVCTTQTPGSVIANQLNKSLGAGQDSLITADEINEIIGALLTQLATSVISDTGLLGQDTSSYDDEEDLDDLTSEITDSINEILENELEYNDIKNDSLNLVQEAINYINLLIDCLTLTGETDKLDLANEFLNGSAYIPQTTISIDLSSLETTILNDLEISDNFIIELNTLLEETADATTTDELTEISEKFMTLYLDIHDLQDISDATIENSGYGVIVEGMENGLTYDIDWLINVFAETTISGGDSGEIIYPPEEDKGIEQRYDECQASCLLNGSCSLNEDGTLSESSSSINYYTP